MSIDNKTDYSVSKEVLAQWGNEVLNANHLHWRTRTNAMRWLLEIRENLDRLLKK